MSDAELNEHITGHIGAHEPQWAMVEITGSPDPDMMGKTAEICVLCWRLKHNWQKSDKPPRPHEVFDSQMEAKQVEEPTAVPEFKYPPIPTLSTDDFHRIESESEEEPPELPDDHLAYALDAQKRLDEFPKAAGMGFKDHRGDRKGDLLVEVENQSLLAIAGFLQQMQICGHGVRGFCSFCYMLAREGEL